MVSQKFHTSFIAWLHPLPGSLCDQGIIFPEASLKLKENVPHLRNEYLTW